MKFVFGLLCTAVTVLVLNSVRQGRRIKVLRNTLVDYGYAISNQRDAIEALQHGVNFSTINHNQDPFRPVKGKSGKTYIN